MKRGVVEDLDLAAPALALIPAPGAAAETIATEKVKAIFFMLAPGESAPAAEGKKVRVTFRDGRQVAGYSPDYREDGPGFFMIPGDTRTNTGRIWVYRSAVKEGSRAEQPLTGLSRMPGTSQGARREQRKVTTEHGRRPCKKQQRSDAMIVRCGDGTGVLDSPLSSSSAAARPARCGGRP